MARAREAAHRKAEIELLMRTVDAVGLSFSLGPRPADAVASDDPELDEALRLAGLQRPPPAAATR